MKFTYRWNCFEDVDGPIFCEYLHDMARKGWLLTEAGMYLLSFERIPPSDIVFCSDFYTGKRSYFIPIEKDEDFIEYRQLCEDSGWDYISPHGHCFIFKNRENEHPVPLTSDESLSKGIFFKKTIWFRSILLVILVSAIAMLGNLPRNELTDLLSFRYIFISLIYMIFFPSLVLRIIRYFFTLYHFLRSQKRHNVNHHAIYFTIYRILQSIFWICAVPLSILSLPTVYSPYFDGYQLYLDFGIFIFICMVIRDVWKYYLHFAYKQKIEKVVSACAMIGVFFFILYMLNPSTSLHQERPAGTLWIDQEYGKGGEFETYRTSSLYIKHGNVVSLYQNLSATPTQDDPYTYRNEKMYSAIYETWSEEKAKTVLDAYLSQEVALHKQSHAHYIYDLVNPSTTLPATAEALADVERLNGDDWQIDGGYRFNEHEYIIRKGNTVAYYMYDGESTEFLTALKTAMQEIA